MVKLAAAALSANLYEKSSRFKAVYTHSSGHYSELFDRKMPQSDQL
uniref:Uncharacterized protein n=1 Tax=Anguilla anguilla TaxID=7936 RepID=A0A0E9UDA9_ANGAN